MGASRCSAGSLSAVPVCLCARLKPANRHAGKSFQIEVSDKFYMFSRGAGSPCKYQPNEEACMWHWYQWRHAVMYLLRMCFELRTVEHVSISGCCRYRYIILRQPASSGWLPRNPEGDVNLIPLKFQFGGIRSAVCVCVRVFLAFRLTSGSCSVRFSSPGRHSQQMIKGESESLQQVFLPKVLYWLVTPPPAKYCMGQSAWSCQKIKNLETTKPAQSTGPM